MALAFDAATDGNVADGTSKTITHTMSASADGVIYALFFWRRTVTAPTSVSATWNGTENMTEIGTSNGANRGIHAFRLIAPTSGAHDVVVSWTNSTNAAVSVISFTGADQTDPDGTPVSGSGNNNAPTSPAVTSAVGHIVLDGVVMDSGALTVGADQTQRSAESLTTANCATSTEPGAASVSMTWSSAASDNWRTIALDIIPELDVTVTPSAASCIAASTDPTFNHTFSPAASSAIAATTAPTFKYTLTPSAASAITATSGGAFVLPFQLHAPYRDFNTIGQERDYSLSSPYRSFRITAPEL